MPPGKTSCIIRLIEEDSWRCAQAHNKSGSEIDHLMPIAFGHIQSFAVAQPGLHSFSFFLLEINSNPDPILIPGGELIIPLSTFLLPPDLLSLWLSFLLRRKVSLNHVPWP